MTRSLFWRHALPLLAGLLAAPALAQAPAASPAPAPSPAAAPAPLTRNPAVERRIGDLHAKLKITPSEEAPFRDFAGVMRDNAARMAVIMQDRQKAAATMTAVDDMQSYGRVAQAHAEDMQRLVPAFSRLYDALTPEQKKSADSSFRQFSNGSARTGS